MSRRPACAVCGAHCGGAALPDGRYAACGRQQGYLHALHGTCACGATHDRRSPARPMANGAGACTPSEAPYVSVRMSQVQRKPIRWLWPDKLAYGKLSLLVGDGDLGKSWAMLDLAARLSTGTPLPGQAERPEARTTVLLMGEDDAADTIGPRLDAQRADSDRVVLLQGVKRAGTTAVVRLQRDLAIVEQQVQDARAVLLVIDPLASYLGGTDGINEIEVRQVLLPLAEMAQRNEVAVVAIMHRNKGEHRNPVNAIGGSVAFGNTARCVLGVCADPDAKGRRCLVPIKGNILKNEEGIGYRIAEGVLQWDNEAVSVTRETIFAAPNGHGTTVLDGDDLRPGRLATARSVLQEILLSYGGRAASDLVEREAKGAGVAVRTLDEARAKLGVVAHKETVDGRAVWFMELPDRGSHD